MDLDWNDLRIFHEAVRSHGYTVAARKLGIDRTTIGRRMQRLEQALGLPIWERTDEGYRPTPLGRKLLAIAARTEKAMATLDGDRAPSRIVRVAGSVGLLDLFQHEIAALLAADATLTIETVGAANATDAVLGRLADIGVAPARELPRGVRGVRAAAFVQARYGRPSSPGALCSWSHAAMQANPFGWARLNRPVAETRLEVNGMTGLRNAVREGIGSAWLWTRIGDRDCRLAELTREAPASAAADLWVFHAAELPPSPAVSHLSIGLAEAIAQY